VLMSSPQVEQCAVARIRPSADTRSGPSVGVMNFVWWIEPAIVEVPP
jgi:hypothetical protein